MINITGSSPGSISLNETKQVIARFKKYEEDGKMIFTVTLTTNVRSDKLAASAAMQTYFETRFMGMINRQLTAAMKRSNPIDFEYIIERSPEGLWHMHGLMAMSKEVAIRLWKEGKLVPALRRNLDSMRSRGKLRSFGLLGYLIEPMRSGGDGIEDWVVYASKTSDRHSSMSGTRRIMVPALNLDPRFGRPTFNKDKPKDFDISSGKGSPADAEVRGATDDDGVMSEAARIKILSSRRSGRFGRPIINKDAFKDFDYSSEEAPFSPAELLRDGGSVPTPDGGAP